MMVVSQLKSNIEQMTLKKNYKNLHLNIRLTSLPKEQSFPSLLRTISPNLHLSKACTNSIHKTIEREFNMLYLIQENIYHL